MRNNISIITFSGVHGAGKTTVLRSVINFLKLKQYKIKELRHRPSILPILSAIKYGKKKASEKTLEVPPRSGKNKSYISSLLRFSYYLIDYL